MVHPTAALAQVQLAGGNTEAADTRDEMLGGIPGVLLVDQWLMVVGEQAAIIAEV